MSRTADPRAAAIAALPIGIAAFDAGRRLVFANPALALLAGVDGEALGSGLTFNDALRVLAWAGLLGDGPPEELAAAWARGAPRRHLAARPDGTRLALELRDLSAGGLLLCLTDVTAEIGAREAAEAEARRLDETLDRLAGGVARFDAGQRLVFANTAYRGLLGLPSALLVPGTSFADLVREQALRGEFGDADVDRLVQAVRGRDRSRRFVHERRRSNGLVLRMDNQPLADGGWIAEVTDVTAERRAELEASRRAALNDAVLAALPIGVAVYGPDRRVALVNAAYNRILADSPIAPGEALADILLRRAQAGHYGPGEPGAQVEAITAGLDQPQRIERRQPRGAVTLHLSAPLPDGGHVTVVSDQTALHQAQAEARRKNDILTAMLENTRHGIIMFDAAGTIIAANKLAAYFCGLPVSAMVPGSSMHELRSLQIAQERQGQDAAMVLSPIETKDTPISAPHRHTRPGPDDAVIEVVTDRLADGGFVRSFTDITALAHAEGEARRRAEMTQALLESVRHALSLVGPDGRVVAANRLAARIVGERDAASMLGRSFAELARQQAGMEYPDDPRTAAAIAEEALRHDRSVPLRYQRQRPDGTRLDVASNPTPDGGFSVSVTDITPLARAEAEAERRAEVLRATLDAAQHGILLYGPDRRIIAANDMAAALCGLPSGASMRGMELRQMLRAQAYGEGRWPADVEQLVAGYEALDRRSRIRYQRQTADGRTLDVVSDPTPDGGFVVCIADVTPLASAQREAERQAATLRATLDAAPIGIALYGPDWRVMAANDLIAEHCGFARSSDMTGLSWGEIYRAMLRREGFTGDPTAELARYASIDRSRRQKYQRQTADNRVLEVISDPTPDGGFIVTFSEVTPLVHARLEAERQAQVLRDTIEASRTAIALFGPDGRLVVANDWMARHAHQPNAVAMVGRHHSDILAEHCARIFADPAEAAARLAQAMELDRTKPQHYRQYCPDGAVYDITSDPTPDHGFVVSISDVTALAQAEAAAEARARILAAMLENIRHGIVLFGSDGRIVAANPKLIEMMGLRPETFAPGRSFREMVEDMHAQGDYGAGPEAEAIVADILARDRRRPVRLTRRRGNGRILDGVSDPTPDGGWVLTFTDVTEERRIRSELESARLAAEQANLAKSRFLATMSHELRTPLNAIIGFSDAMRSGAPPERTSEMADAIHEAGQQLLSMIEDILQVTRAEMGALPVLAEPTDPALAAATALRMMQVAAAAAEVKLALEAPADLPRISADPRRLHQVLMNLLSNAIKFSPPGGTVTLTVSADPAGLDIAVRDEGIGIEPAALARAFEPFTQLDSAITRRYGGSGLGLHLARVLTEAQGAILTLDSAPGKGTIARLHFPAHRLLPSG